MSRRALILAGMAILVGAVVAYADLARPGDRDGTSPRASQQPDAVAVKGHVKGLYPGAQKTLRSRARNKAPYAVTLRSVKAKVKKAGPGCPRKAVSTKASRGQRTIPAHRSRRIAIRVKMKASAPDACQNATFRIRFRARAFATGSAP
jgi:hypothetical protein